MRLSFIPDATTHNGVFKYLFDRFGDNIKNYVEIFGTSYSDTTLFSIINDSFPIRYASATGAPTNFYLVFRGFSVKITNYSISHLNTNCFTKEWNLYDLTNSDYKLISNDRFTLCGNGDICAGNQIQFFQVTSNSFVKSLKFDQIGGRSDGQYYVEFQTLELYGKLVFDNNHLRSTMHCYQTRFLSTLLVCFIFS